MSAPKERLRMRLADLGETMRPSARRSGIALAALLVGVMSSGCAGVVTPPPSPDDPVEVYLLDFYGPHTSLVLPRRSGGMVRYGYCDWRWCVEGRRNILTGTSALLWPTASGVGRAEYPGIRSREELGRLVPDGDDGVYRLRAGSAGVRALQQRLDAHFNDNGDATASRRAFGMEFVRHPRGYWFAHQSNLLLADWLREMGFEIRSYPLMVDWRLKDPAEGSDGR